MKAEVLNNLDNPRQLEKLYRDDKPTFKRAFNSVYPDIKESPVAQIWNERLNFEKDDISWGSGKELTFVLMAAFMAGLVAKLPTFFTIDPEYFYPRNVGFIVFPFLMAYFAWKQKLFLKNLLPVSLAILASVIYINVLPNNNKSDTLILACIHLPLFLWSMLGFTYVGGDLKNDQGRLNFLRYNGDLVVMTTIILIAGGGLTAITLGLYELIGLKIGEFYFQNIAIWGLAAAPLVGTYLVQTNPQLVNMVSPVVAKIFTPLVFTTLVIYLIAVIYTGKDPYNDREFLLIFNLLLIGVMALILFSIAGTAKHSESRMLTFMLFGLSMVTIILNGIALSAIIFRISEWGLTPNKLAVLGGNILILINLLLVTYRLFITLKDYNQITTVERSIASFLPIYSLWTIMVIFLFPILFSFK
ncbi:MAG: rane protein [Spirosoma sp.]|nr:rane protein [Spirosoma sp.]